MLCILPIIFTVRILSLFVTLTFLQESLDSDAKEHALDKRINVIKEQNRAILKRTREVRHDKELHC